MYVDEITARTGAVRMSNKHKILGVTNNLSPINLTFLLPALKAPSIHQRQQAMVILVETGHL